MKKHIHGGGWVGITFFALILTISVACSSRDRESFSEAGWEEQVEQTRIEGLYAPNHDGKRFFAPWMRMPDKSFFQVLGWKLFPETRYTREEKNFLPRMIPGTAGRIAAAQGNFIVWIGHNTFLLRLGDTFWLTDPIFSKRALVPARITPPALTPDELNPLIKNLHILLSHNHYDHLDRASMKALPQDAAVFAPKGLKPLIASMNKTRITEMDWWEEIRLDNGFRLICLPAQHWSMRISQGRNQSLWASFLLVTPTVTLYFGGDSGYFKGFREIGRKFPGIDYAFMATTAYHPRWFMHYAHMDIREAVKGFDELGARIFIPTQWGTFHLGSEPPGFPGLDLKRYIRDNRLDPDRFQIPDIGEILAIP